MRLELTGRHVTISPSVRKIVERQLAPILRRLNDSAVSTQVVLTKEKARCRAEVTLHARGEHFLHGNGLGRDVATALAAALAKIDSQAETLKGKWQARKRRAAPKEAAGVAGEALSEEPQEVRIVRARRSAVKPMSVEEAALVVSSGSQQFLVFRNAADDAVMVLFRRPDG